MKIKIFDYRSGGRILSDYNLPYTHNQEIEGDTSDVSRLVKEFMDVGLNVMSYYLRSTGDVVVAIDNFRFQTR